MEWAKLISELGFPTVIALYLLIRLDSSLKDLTLEIRALKEEIRVTGDKNRPKN